MPITKLKSDVCSCHALVVVAETSAVSRQDFEQEQRRRKQDGAGGQGGKGERGEQKCSCCVLLRACCLVVYARQHML